MGLWNFIKDAGKVIGIGGDEAPDADALKKEVADLGLDASGVDIETDGDTVKVSGKSLTQELREKIVLAVGNVAGVAAVEDNIEAEEPAPEAVFHTVDKGDTLWAVSKKAYGDGSKYMKSFEANKPMLSDPDKIYPGQVLRIPQD
ncbi:MAG: peptidoglycan-binding protein LysM [Paracoccaceae bacterium]|jgi:nucleoid-associated protein YgaU|nr:peptidoglycan-binding protein LysM [Paracoccaceae bacterium]